jgi:hypothetical protein
MEQIGKNTIFGRRVCPMGGARAMAIHEKFMLFCYEKKHSYAFLNSSVTAINKLAPTYI